MTETTQCHPLSPALPEEEKDNYRWQVADAEASPKAGFPLRREGCLLPVLCSGVLDIQRNCNCQWQRIEMTPENSISNPLIHKQRLILSNLTKQVHH